MNASYETLQETPQIMAARALLDDALVAARRIATEDPSRERVVEGLGEALRLVYVALSSLGDYAAFHHAKTTAAEVLGVILGALQAPDIDDAVVNDVVMVTARSMRLLLGAPLPVFEAPPSLPRAEVQRPMVRATVGVPTLLDLTREVMRPMVSLPEQPPPEPIERDTDVPHTPSDDLDALRAEGVATLAALDADDDDAATLAPTPDRGTATYDAEHTERCLFGEQSAAIDVLLDRARGCIEDLGTFGLARRPKPDETWWAPRTEARLLTRLDALAAFGPSVLPWLVRMHEERPVPDAEYTWALVMLFASIAGDDAIDQAMRIARVTPASEEALRDALADALTHAPHPRVAELLMPWLHDASAARRVVALTALGRRGALTAASLEEHLRDTDTTVLRAALESLAYTPDVAPRSVLRNMLHHPDADVLAAALDVVVRLGSSDALERAKELFAEGTPDRGDAAMHIAIASGEEGLALLHGEGALTELRCEALGWYGHAASVGVLLHALEVGAKPVQASAAEALWRMTGAALTDEEPNPEFEVEPFSGEVFTDDVMPEVLDELSVKRAVWEAWWSSRAARVDASQRWRFGRPWRICDLVRVLAARTSRPRERRWSALELVARTGSTIPFDAWRFLQPQVAQIEAWRAVAQSTASGWTVRGGWR